MKLVAYIVLGAIVLLLVGAQAGMLRGRQPVDLGVKNGRLKAPSLTRNSVSSQATLYADHPQRDYAGMAPLPFKDGGAEESMRVLQSVLRDMPGVTVVAQRPDYLYAQAQTRWLKFVDDLEFWSNPASGSIELRSASRLGREDFGVNRQRMEVIRAAYLAMP
ncbi:DUF1499 domain-containing protein [Hydrogenophaga sp.]|uniref:DUF1499 domain-containing protein n=1 Tax=Hydrogenophaga sp. TaxID=1904254 RepID=UPI003D0D2AB9